MVAPCVWGERAGNGVPGHPVQPGGWDEEAEDRAGVGAEGLAPRAAGATARCNEYRMGVGGGEVLN